MSPCCLRRRTHTAHRSQRADASDSGCQTWYFFFFLFSYPCMGWVMSRMAPCMLARSSLVRTDRTRHAATAQRAPRRDAADAPTGATGLQTTPLLLGWVEASRLRAVHVLTGWRQYGRQSPGTYLRYVSPKFSRLLLFISIVYFFFCFWIGELSWSSWLLSIGQQQQQPFCLCTSIPSCRAMDAQGRSVSYVGLGFRE